VRSAGPPRAGAERPERRVPMSRLRQRMAVHLLEATSQQALVTTFNEVDLTAVQELRARHHAFFEKAAGPRLGIVPFFVKASVEALQRFPIVNARIDGGDVVYHDDQDIGVAVSTDRGLLVPVLRNCGRKGLRTIEAEVARLALRARQGDTTLEELRGGTFTITNGGVFGSLLSTPIVNAPQGAILGMHAIQERPVVVEGAIAIRPMMYLALTYDHRLIDGRDAVQFLMAVKDLLEDPRPLLRGE
jgi:2-oxoglutarate dehydrogenase E2 component (dihydrolipoamide succinyltransferase)